MAEIIRHSKRGARLTIVSEQHLVTLKARDRDRLRWSSGFSYDRWVYTTPFFFSPNISHGTVLEGFDDGVDESPGAILGSSGQSIIPLVPTEPSVRQSEKLKGGGYGGCWCR